MRVVGGLRRILIQGAARVDTRLHLRLHMTLDHPTDFGQRLGVMVAGGGTETEATLIFDRETLARKLMMRQILMDDVGVTATPEHARRLRGEHKLVQILSRALRPGGLARAQCWRHHKVVLVAAIAILRSVVLHAQAVSHLVAGHEHSLHDDHHRIGEREREGGKRKNVNKLVLVTQKDMDRFFDALATISDIAKGLAKGNKNLRKKKKVNSFEAIVRKGLRRQGMRKDKRV